MAFALRALVPAVVLTTLSVAVAFAQDTGQVNPDRPGIGTGAETVARGALQMETGLDYTRERRTSWATTLRFGAADGVELRLDWEPVVSLRGAEHATDIGDLALGTKLRLLQGGDGDVNPTISLLPTVKLPTAPAPVGTERTDVSLLALVSFRAGPVDVDFNAGVAAIGQPRGYLLQALTVGTVNWPVTDALAPFAEVFYNSPAERGGDDLVGASVGVVVGITRDIALDAAAITTLAGRGPNYRFQAGVTVRFWP